MKVIMIKVVLVLIILSTNMGRLDNWKLDIRCRKVLVNVLGYFYDREFIDWLGDRLGRQGFCDIDYIIGDSVGLYDTWVRGDSLGVGYNLRALYSEVDSYYWDMGYDLVVYYMGDNSFLWASDYYSLEKVVGLSIGRYIFIANVYDVGYLPLIYIHEFGHYLGMGHCDSILCYMGRMIDDEVMVGFCDIHQSYYDSVMYSINILGKYDNGGKMDRGDDIVE